MSDGLTVRDARIEDAETVATLFSEFNRLLGADGLPAALAFLDANVLVDGPTMMRRLERIVAVEHTLLAESDGQAVGLCCLRLLPYIGQDVPYAEVTQLYVRPQAQRRGVGAALLKTAEQRAASAGATAVHIVTGADNSNAQAFYGAQGYSMPCVEFEKFLTAVDR
jgi:GNAT superfamily N-acetyltransferase